MKKIEGFTETILTANPKENKLNLGVIKIDANRISQKRFDQIENLIEKKIKELK